MRPSGFLCSGSFGPAITLPPIAVAPLALAAVAFATLSAQLSRSREEIFDTAKLPMPIEGSGNFSAIGKTWHSPTRFIVCNCRLGQPHFSGQLRLGQRCQQTRIFQGGHIGLRSFTPKDYIS